MEQNLRYYAIMTREICEHIDYARERLTSHELNGEYGEKAAEWDVRFS